MRLFYYIHDVGNFGDELSPVIVGKLLGREFATIAKPEIRRRRRNEKFLFALGSIFQFVQDGDVLWGTGVNLNRKNPKTMNRLDIRAVRGPLTRDFIINNYGLPCPEIYGDPALLLPRLFPELKPNPIRKYAIIPHGADNEFFKDSENVILPTAGWPKVLAHILESELVISSGLHGIILAEAFGIPARWLRHESLPSYNTEGIFKYNDYYLSTNREPNDWAPTVEDALRLKGQSPIKKDFTSLADAFPKDLFSVKKQIVSGFTRWLDRMVFLLKRY